MALAQSGSPTVRYEREIYDGSAADLMKTLQQTEPSFQTIMIVGHNPSISQLSELLDPAGEAVDSASEHQPSAPSSSVSTTVVPSAA